MSDTTQTKTQNYDRLASQSVTLEIEDGNELYEVSYRLSPFDGLLPEYDRLREISLVADGGDQTIETRSDTADCWLFDQIADDVSGFEGEKPENWKQQIDTDEKSHVVRRLLAVKSVAADAPATKRLRSWGPPSDTETVQLLSFFDGVEVATSITLKRPRPSDISKYNRLKTRISVAEGKGLDDSAIKIPAQMQAKADIAADLLLHTVGYEHEPPLHHLALAVTMLFEKSIRTAKKK